MTYKNIQEHILSIKLFCLKIMFRHAQLNKLKLIFMHSYEWDQLSNKINLIKLHVSTRAHATRREIWQKPLRVLYHDVRLNFDLTISLFLLIWAESSCALNSLNTFCPASVRPSVRKPFNSPEPKTQVITWGQNLTLKLNIEKSLKIVSNIKNQR